MNRMRLTIKLRPISFERKVTFTYDLNLMPGEPVSEVTHSFTWMEEL
jgi:hypothetical protein